MAQRHQVETRKAYSQNFLRPGRLVNQLVAAAGIGEDDVVVEIGGGSGVLTRALEATGCHLLVVERDPRYSDILRSRYDGHSRVTVIAGDVQDLRWPSEPFRVFANVPFGQTTEILRMLLEDSGPGMRRADLVLQYDVARKRSAAPQGNKLNLMWAPWWTSRLGRRVPAQSFTPRPRVDAAMFVVQRRVPPLLPWSDRSLWQGLLDAAFNRGGDRASRALRGVLTATQWHRLAGGRGIPAAATVSKLTLEDWLALHETVRERVPRERWPRAAGKHRPRRRDSRPVRSARSR